MITVTADLDVDASERMQALARIARDVSGVGPHVSLASFHGNPPLEGRSGALGSLAARSAALPIRLGAVGAFGGGPDGHVLFLAPVVTEALLALHRHCHEALSDYAAEAVDYYRPGRWVPHVTIAVSLDRPRLAAKLAEALEQFVPYSALYHQSRRASAGESPRPMVAQRSNSLVLTPVAAMHEPALDLTGVTLSPQKEIVRVFYKEMWDKADKSLITRIFHEGFTFRGSLGPVLTGHAEFAGYVDWVTGAFGDYTSDILVMVEEGPRVMAKLRFHGFHRAEMFGVPPSGRHVWWTGMPIFTFEGGRVRDLYVLGDIHGLIARMKGEA